MMRQRAKICKLISLRAKQWMRLGNCDGRRVRFSVPSEGQIPLAEFALAMPNRAFFRVLSNRKA